MTGFVLRPRSRPACPHAPCPEPTPQTCRCHRAGLVPWAEGEHGANPSRMSGEMLAAMRAEHGR